MNCIWKHARQTEVYGCQDTCMTSCVSQPAKLSSGFLQRSSVVVSGIVTACWQVGSSDSHNWFSSSWQHPAGCPAAAAWAEWLWASHIAWQESLHHILAAWSHNSCLHYCAGLLKHILDSLAQVARSKLVNPSQAHSPASSFQVG